MVQFPCVGFSGGSNSKESTFNVGDQGSIPGLGRSPGEGKGYPLQYSCLENSMDRGTQRATVHGVAKVGCDLAIKSSSAASSMIFFEQKIEADIMLCKF